jgi:hypothetical protein
VFSAQAHTKDILPTVRLFALTVSVMAINVLNGCTVQPPAASQSSTRGSTLVQAGQVLNARDDTVTLRLDNGDERVYGTEAGASFRIGDRVKIITRGGTVQIMHWSGNSSGP